MDVGLSISDTADILGFFDSLESLVQHSNKQKKNITWETVIVSEMFCWREVVEEQPWKVKKLVIWPRVNIMSSQCYKPVL